MKTLIFTATLFFSCAVSLFSEQAVSAKTYKWVDDGGKTSFSDQVSPEEAKYRHETLSKKGRVIAVTEQEKTKEQQNRENQLNLLRKKQEKIIQNQKDRDDALLRSYHSKEDMLSELKEKTQTIEAQRKLIESEITQQLERLDTKQKSAATFERNAQPIPPNLIEEIKAIQGEIQQTKVTIDENLTVQKKLADEYEASIKRFLMLTQTNESARQNKVASIEEADALGLFRCENDPKCEKAWEIAHVFVTTYSTTAPDINTEKLIMHALPTKDSDISLSIAEITSSKNTEDQIFLDIHCRDSSLGKELCESPKIQALRASFRSYVNERLNSKVPTP
ncbi:MAG: DUF4124 domain-containing protein [Methylococcales bacterium]|jgi:hypothetical protein